jgi:pimeloyl-ACP methyl ester carboxylesterase
VLLDALEVERAAVVGFSAGGPSVIQFALRHPDRTSGLVLLGSALPGTAGGPPGPVARLLFTDPVCWTLKASLPTLFLRCLGMPKGFHPTPQQRIGILESEESLFPIHPASGVCCVTASSPTRTCRATRWRSSACRRC